MRLLDMDVDAAARLIREMGPALSGWPGGLVSPQDSVLSVRPSGAGRDADARASAANASFATAATVDSVDAQDQPRSRSLTASMRTALQSGDAASVQRLIDSATGFLETQLSRRTYEYQHGLPSGAPYTHLDGGGDRSSVVSLDSLAERRLLLHLGGHGTGN